MTFGGTKATVFLFAGDVIAFIFSLWLMLLVRYLALPGQDLFIDHFQAFLACTASASFFSKTNCGERFFAHNCLT